MRTSTKRAPKISIKSKLVRRAAWGLVAAGSAFAASRSAQMAMTKGYEKTRGKKSPGDPQRRTPASWPSVIGWSVATAVVVGLVQLLAERGAVAGWTYATGHRPPRT
jgi:hypothetical protein